MKQKLKRFMAGFMAMLTLVGTLFTNGTTAFAASPQANIAFWNASVKNSGEVSELKPGYNHGKILYSILDGNSAYCMNFGLRADGGQLMNSYDDASTSMSAQQRKLLSYCLYYGFNSTQKAAPSNSQCDEYIATQAMVWVIVADIFGTGSGDSAARKLCNTAPSPDSSYSYYERLRDNISSSYNATLPSFASRRTSEAPTYELKWNDGSQRFETTLSDSNGVLSDFDFGISGYSVDKNGNSITISSTSVNTTATTGTFTSNAGKVETTSSCVFWLTGKSGYQEFISERPTADPIKAYIKVKTENIGYGELTKTDESSGVKLSGAVYGIYSDSGCTNRVQTMTTDGNGYAKSAALVAGTYYVKEITAPKGYVLSGKVHTLTVKAGQTTGISATDKEQLGAITIYKEGEVLSSWNGSNFTYEKKKLSGAAFKVTAGADIYKADGTKVYSAGDVVAESLTTGTDGQVILSDLHLGTYVVTEIKSIDGYTINTTPQTVAVEYKDQTVTVQYESTTIENTRQKADVSVVKKDSDTENPLDGGKYTLYAGNDIKNYAGQVIVTKGTALETVTTGEDGSASYSVDLPISNGYYISETQAPYAYIRNQSDVYSFNFNVLPETQAKASFSHTFKNDRTTAKIHIYKVDKESGKAVPQGDASLEGAVYGLYARNDIVHPDGATGVVFKAGDLVATLTTDKNGEAEVNNLYLGNYYVKEITPSEGYLLDEEEHDVVCDYEGDLVAEVSRSTTSAEQVIKQPFQLIKVSDNGDDTEAGLLAGAEFTAYLKSSLPVKEDGSYDFDKATPVVIGENGATTITSDDKGHAVSIAIPYGTYVVVESKTPHNMKTIKPFEVKISENHPDKPQTSYNFIIGMLYTQIFQELYYQADFNCGGRLPIHVTFMLDEFANVALPDDFCSLLSTMRSREISSIIIIQNFAQLKALFKDTWETIPGNCDTFIYLGGNEQSTHKYVSELLGKGTIDKKSSGETKGRQGSSSRNYDVLGRELFTPDEVRKLDNKKCIIFIRGIDPIMDNKFIPFNHSMFNQTADGKGEPYVHQIRGADILIGPPFEILSDKAVKYYEKLRDKGENVYIDSLTYEQFMMLGDAELSRRFSMQDEAEQKAKIDREQANELEYVDESQKSDTTECANSSNGSAGTKPVRNPEREKPKWEDTITNRMLHWSYTPEQKEEVKKALAAGVPKATILTYFYPEVTVEKMSSYRKKQ